MDDKTKIEIAWATNNTIRLLGFIALAIAFDKWWIVIFSEIFMLTKN